MKYLAALLAFPLVAQDPVEAPKPVSVIGFKDVSTLEQRMVPLWGVTGEPIIEIVDGEAVQGWKVIAPPIEYEFHKNKQAAGFSTLASLVRSERDLAFMVMVARRWMSGKSTLRQMSPYEADALKSWAVGDSYELIQTWK